MFMPGQWQRVLGHQLIDFAYGIPADSMEPGERAAAVRVLASRLYGTYVALCYLSPLLGGWLADRYFGLFTMLFAGCVCITLGHALMVSVCGLEAHGSHGIVIDLAGLNGRLHCTAHAGVP
jgi:MFS family permease